MSGRIRISRLGVKAQPAGGSAGVDGVPIVLACGSLIPLKRIHLVPPLLEALDRPVRWVHFGDGPERQRVVAAAHALPNTLRASTREL